MALPLGYRIGAACVAGRLRINGGVVTDGKLGIKSGASVSLSSGRSCNAGYEPRGHYTATDPATATNFLEAAYDASEIYFEAA